MALVKILVDYGASEGWKVGDIVDMTDPTMLIQEGKVELVTDAPVEATVEAPVVEEPTTIVTPVAEPVITETPIIEAEIIEPVVTPEPVVEEQTVPGTPLVTMSLG